MQRWYDRSLASRSTASCTAVLLFLIGIVAAVSDSDLIDRKPLVITSDYEFTERKGVVVGFGDPCRTRTIFA